MDPVKKVEYDRIDALLKAGEKPKLWKPVASVLKSVNQDAGTVDVVMTTSDIDRDGDRVVPEGMKAMDPPRVPLVAAHFYYDLMNHIGDVQGIKQNSKRITSTPTYFKGMGNPQADWGWILVQLGVAAYSIGFIPGEVAWADFNDEKLMERIKAGKDPMRTFQTWELAELSHVIVPSNRAAVQRMTDIGILTGEQAEAAFAKAVETPLAARADLLLQRAFKQFEAERPTKLIVAVPADAGDEGEGKAVDNDVMAMFDATKDPDIEEKAGTWKVGGARGLTQSGDAWDAGAARGSLGTDWGNWKKAHIVYNADAADTKGGYKLPFAKISGGKMVAVTRGLQAARGALSGARAGISLPDDVVTKAKAFVDSYLGAPKDDVVPEEKDTIAGAYDERVQNLIDSQVTMDEAVADLRDDVTRIYEIVRDAFTEFKDVKARREKTERMIEDTRSDLEKRLNSIPNDSAAFVSAKVLIDTVMAGVRELIDERILLARGDPDQFVASAKSRKRK